MLATSSASQTAPVTPSVTAAPAGTVRETTAGRPTASASIGARPKPSTVETRHATSHARSQRGTSAGVRAEHEPHVLGDPEPACTRLELALELAVADERERASAPRRARDRERLDQAQQVLARDVGGDADDARAVAVPAERGGRDRRVAVGEGLHVDARADDVRAARRAAR